MDKFNWNDTILMDLSFWLYSFFKMLQEFIDSIFLLLKINTATWYSNKRKTLNKGMMKISKYFNGKNPVNSWRLVLIHVIHVYLIKAQDSEIILIDLFIFVKIHWIKEKYLLKKSREFFVKIYAAKDHLELSQRWNHYKCIQCNERNYYFRSYLSF